MLMHEGYSDLIVPLVSLHASCLPVRFTVCIRCVRPSIAVLNKVSFTENLEAVTHWGEAYHG